MNTETHVRELEVELVVRERRDVAQGVVALTLARPTDRPAGLDPRRPLDLLLGDDLTRQYSLCGDTADPNTWRVGVLREPRAGEDRHTCMTTCAKAHAFVAADRAITFHSSPPALHLRGAGSASPDAPDDRRGQRGRRGLAPLFRGPEPDVDGLRRRLTRYADRVTVVPQDESGVLDLGRILGAPRTDTLVYVCGPEGLLGAVEAACASWPTGALHLERFAAKAAANDGAADHPFEVVLQRSGLTLTVPADGSIFQTVREAGVSVLGSCLEGVCGTCETAVIDGAVDHRDSVLSAEEQTSSEYLMICVSRCTGTRLTLDL